MITIYGMTDRGNCYKPRLLLAKLGQLPGDGGEGRPGRARVAASTSVARPTRPGPMVRRASRDCRPHVTAG